MVQIETEFKCKYYDHGDCTCSWVSPKGSSCSLIPLSKCPYKEGYLHYLAKTRSYFEACPTCKQVNQTRIVPATTAYCSVYCNAHKDACDFNRTCYSVDRWILNHSIKATVMKFLFWLRFSFIGKILTSVFTYCLLFVLFKPLLYYSSDPTEDCLAMTIYAAEILGISVCLSAAIICLMKSTILLWMSTSYGSNDIVIRYCKLFNVDYDLIREEY